jgi:hypothetical protein
MKVSCVRPLRCTPMLHKVITVLLHKVQTGDSVGRSATKSEYMRDKGLTDPRGHEKNPKDSSTGNSWHTGKHDKRMRT